MEQHKCSGCKVMLSEEYYGTELKRTGRYKTCLKCRQRIKAFKKLQKVIKRTEPKDEEDINLNPETQ